MFFVVAPDRLCYRFGVRQSWAMKMNHVPPFYDPYDLVRFVQAQASNYERAISEIRKGQKETHWMWYVFPQFDGLAFSSRSKHYAIKSVAEAEAYLRHPILGPRLRESAEATLAVEGRTASEIFGSPDDMKLQSSATLFAVVSPPGSAFDKVLEKYFGGQRDARTIDLLKRSAA